MSTPGRRTLAALFCGIVFGLLVLLTTGAAHAQGNYRSSPMGGRTTLLGGTGVVYGMDGASAIINPATALRIDPGRLAFSVNFYAAQFTTAPHWYQPGPIDTQKFGSLQVGGTSMSDVRLTSLPSSLCLFFRVGRIHWFKKATENDPRFRDARLGLCAATTQTESFYYSNEGYQQTSSQGVVTRQSQAFAQTFSRFQFGPTYSMWLVPGLTIGASIHASISNQWSSLTAIAHSEQGILGTPINSMFQSSSHGTSWQLHAIAGATYTFGRQSVGLAVEAPSLHLFGTGGASLYTQSDAGGNQSSVMTGQGGFNARTPLRVTLGTGIARKWGTAELDVSWFSPMSPAYDAVIDGNRVDTVGNTSVSSSQSFELSQRARGVVNVGVGAEVFLRPQISLLGGLSTDISAVPKGELSGTLVNYYPARTNRVAASFGVGSYRGDGALLLGLELSYGWGDRLAVNSYQAPPTIATAGQNSLGVLFVIAGGTSFRAISRAVQDVTRILTKPNDQQNEPTPENSSPAIEAPPKKGAPP
ncbi:hypothetical protein AKJ09_04738 [Labilithrix luteola]|uniref:Long-chain fatty acid transport protein n=1 Tax=Labilithrix luteola TaxID=1391654 RepID=A0A0K1PY51_9BACT|nr:hypothetical protein [Labilithrix luteola]AKU98074.1 hypothetical protein AKJ09_04738 [Labilithrix luteola]